MCDSYIAELRDEDELDPTKLTDDVRLLNSGVKMTSRDIKAMLKRNSDNRTMLQVILRYADEHNIETAHGGRIWNGTILQRRLMFKSGLFSECTKSD